MTEKKTHALGEVIKAKSVTRPDGSEIEVSDGLYVLDTEGTFFVDGSEVTVK